jgi:hypothetical protein
LYVYDIELSVHPRHLSLASMPALPLQKQLIHAILLSTEAERAQYLSFLESDNTETADVDLDAALTTEEDSESSEDSDKSKSSVSSTSTMRFVAQIITSEIIYD